ncbi:MAG: FAD-dependent oxidoreductase, partial [Ramlibacter sp.]|nr:FAD-dependent oxidoreductase [Ramlibacter sp.]
AAGAELGQGEVVIVAAAMASADLLQGLSLQAVRGQVTWALRRAPAQLPPFPVNGDGGLIPALPTSEGLAWLCGSSFDRDAIDLAAREVDQQANLSRLRRLLPSMAPAIEASLGPNSLRSWTGVRCASSDRRPLAGPVDEHGADGRWLSTAMGSRGLTFAVLCAELIAARIHHEPLPLARKLASALAPNRHKKPAAGRASVGELAYPDNARTKK